MIHVWAGVWIFSNRIPYSYRVLTIGASLATALECVLDIIPKLEDVSIMSSELHPVVLETKMYAFYTGFKITSMAASPRILKSMSD